MSLYELNTKIKSCFVLDEDHVVSAEDGEILNLEQFEALEMEKADKVENLACYVKNLRAKAAACSAEATVLNSRAMAYLKEAARSENYLAGVLYGEKFESPRCKITWRKSEICNILSLDEIPAEYKKEKIEIIAVKADIKKALKAGVDVPGAEIIEKLNMTLK